ncbi:FG-GAP repeat protein [Sorangium sp. So ce117]|uniref:FG-GAP repeat protein n=1 Tax=Sorangium sp. So ce117 TaxID=3133277 RepID=UPI003F5DF127
MKEHIHTLHHRGRRGWQRAPSAAAANLNGDGHADLAVTSWFTGVGVRLSACLPSSRLIRHPEPLSLLRHVAGPDRRDPIEARDMLRMLAELRL